MVMENNDKPKRLPYLFAKNQGVIAAMEEEGNILVYHLATPSLQILAEIKRLLGGKLILKEVNESEFQQQLAHIYQSQGSILDAAEGMEEEMDLSLLAGQLPISEDLLDNQDDAPIIRLLNALFTQAIKQKASDIHIETYENRVLVRNRLLGDSRSKLIRSTERVVRSRQSMDIMDAMDQMDR